MVNSFFSLSFFDKINAAEKGVSEDCVARSAEKAKELQDALDFVPWEILPGYRCFCVDGNVLAKTDMPWACCEFYASGY